MCPIKNDEIILLIEVIRYPASNDRLNIGYYNLRSLKSDLRIIIGQNPFTRGEIVDSNTIINFNNNSEEQFILDYNSEKFTSLLQLISAKEDEIKDSDNVSLITVIEQEIAVLKNAEHRFLRWFRRTGNDIVLSQLLSAPKKVGSITKKEKYYQLFNQFLNDPNITDEEVKKILNDKKNWKNPSQYLRLSRRKKDITVKELQAKPGFGWIDPKGTAID